MYGLAEGSAPWYWSSGAALVKNSHPDSHSYSRGRTSHLGTTNDCKYSVFSSLSIQK